MKLAHLFEKQSALNDSVEKQIEMLRRDCSDIIKLYQKTRVVLLRGEGIRARSFESDIRDHRRPLAMAVRYHNALVKAFDELELPVNRNNGLFTTTKHGFTSEWGQCYVIFPKNGWQGLYFDRVHRGYVYDEFEDRLPLTDVYDEGKRAVSDPEKVKKLVESLRPIVFDKSTGQKPLDARVEDILIRGPGYYGFRNSHQADMTDLPQIFEALGIHPANVAEIGSHWEDKNGIKLDEWKANVLKKYPKAKFVQDEMSEDHWYAKLGDLYVGTGWFAGIGTKKHVGLTRVFLEPRAEAH